MAQAFAMFLADLAMGFLAIAAILGAVYGFATLVAIIVWLGQ